MKFLGRGVSKVRAQTGQTNRQADRQTRPNALPGRIHGR